MQPNFIERVEIKGLWRRYDIDWQLNEDVNILIGENGSGKSTVLRLIYGRIQRYVSNGAIMDITPKGNSAISVDITLNNNKLLTTLTEQQYPINFEWIDTFDVFIRDDKSNQKNGFNSKTYLDKELEEIINQYVEYQLTINQRLQKLFFSNDKIDVAKKREEIFGKQRYFIDTVNRLFQATGKIYNEEVNKIEFKIGDTTITPYQLSSGEKQLLIILLTALVQDGQPFIFLLDEPEISLHLDWQEQLIEIIRTLNPNCQLIIVTHSPGIMMDGWLDKVTEMKTIVHPANLVPAE